MTDLSFTPHNFHGNSLDSGIHRESSDKDLNGSPDEMPIADSEGGLPGDHGPDTIGGFLTRNWRFITAIIFPIACTVVWNMLPVSSATLEKAKSEAQGRLDKVEERVTAKIDIINSQLVTIKEIQQSAHDDIMKIIGMMNYSTRPPAAPAPYDPPQIRKREIVVPPIKQKAKPCSGVLCP